MHAQPNGYRADDPPFEEEYKVRAGQRILQEIVLALCDRQGTRDAVRIAGADFYGDYCAIRVCDALRDLISFYA